jgi:hypothetical protein
MKTFKRFISSIIISGLFFIPAIYSAEVRSLKDLKISKISLRTENVLKIPGSTIEIGLVAFTEDNHISRTTGFLDGKLPWKNFEVQVDGAKFRSGKITIPKADSLYEKGYLTLSFYSVYDPEKVFKDTIRLDYMTGISLFPTNKYRSNPGEDIEFGMDVIYQNGIRENYKSLTKYDDFEEEFNVKVRSGKFKKNEIIVEDDPALITGHKTGIWVQSRRYPAVSDVFEVVLDYNGKYSMSGNGMWGTSGFSGSSGSSGGVGEHGRHGQDGEPGYHGDYGHDLDVFVHAYQDTILNSPMVKVLVVDLTVNKEKRYLLNPNGASLYISAQGGDGGSGGSGGSGGNGGQGKTGEFYTEEVKEIVISKDTAGREIKKEVVKTITKQRPGGDGGHGGEGGWGGPGGNGGHGGSVILSYTEGSEPYLKLITINASGGDGGRGGSGGSGGTGGSGGQGSSSGRKGKDGRSGAWGPYGYQGMNGPVDYRTTDYIPW